MSRPQLILGRWVSLVCCGSIVSALWIIGEAPLRSLLGPTVDHLASIRPDVLTSTILMTFIAGCWPFGRRRWLAFLGVKRFWTYPPLWVAFAAALLILHLHTGMTEGWRSVLGAYTIVGWSITQVPLWLWGSLVVLAATMKLTKEKPVRNSTKDNDGGTGYEHIVHWLDDDQEISHPDGDRFGHDEVARRIVDRLTQKEGESPTMAVVGPLGSGKSTIRGLVAHHLSAHLSVQMINLSLWPFDSPEAAVAGILRTVVRLLGDQVNTLAVTGLSEKYVNTVERVSGRWGALAPYLRGESRPEALLEQLSSIANAAGVKLVLWIEDMERFTGADRLSHEDVAIREAERLGPILALLHLLDRCDSITVIIGDISLRSRLDVGKIARFVENPPRLRPILAWQQIAILRSACLAQEFIDPANDEYREKLAVPENNIRFESWFWRAHDSKLSVPLAIVTLLNTPRSFKWALRITRETWEKLRGELDFDSVLVTTALRVVRPDVFALIDEHTDLFRHGFRDPMSSVQGKQTKHPILVQLESLLEKEETDKIRNAVRAVISFVFPNALSNDENDNEYVERPQGLSVNRHVDYWQRYLSLPNVSWEESDQAALLSIKNWKALEANDLVIRILNPDKARQIETFVGRFSPAELCRLLTEVAEALRDQSAADWEKSHNTPGIKSVWRMMHLRRPRAEMLTDTLKRLIETLIPCHLPLIHDIYYYFAIPDRNVPPLLDGPNRAVIGANMIETFRATFPPGESERLLAAVQDGSPFIIHWICWGLDRIRANQTSGIPFDEWSPVAEMLLEAAERDPEHGIPLVVPFVTKGDFVSDYGEPDESGVSRSDQVYVAEFDEEAARTLFDFDRLVRLLAATELPSHIDGQPAVLFAAAHDAAVAWLDGNEGPNDTNVPVSDSPN